VLVTLVATLPALAACAGTSTGDASLAGAAVRPSTTEAPAATTAPATTAPATTVLSTTEATTTTVATTTVATTTTAVSEASGRPSWLGTRVLPVRPDGYGEIQPTPPELVDRRLPPPPTDLPPPTGDGFEAVIVPVPPDVVARSTWQEGCPVALDDLRYVTLTYWGFDDRPHTGELIVHAAAADAMADVFEQLYAARFPIEEMRVVRADELDAPPTGDGNNTTVFSCRPATGSTSSWSQHAYGLAIDINPFHNPYLRDDVVLPELASAYLERDDVRPGMIVEGDVVVQAFDAVGWGWGGRWRTLKDWQHFSSNGR
jgi:hypothetical protein